MAPRVAAAPPGAEESVSNQKPPRMKRFFCQLVVPAACALFAALPAQVGAAEAQEDTFATLRRQAEQGDMHATQQLYMRYAVAGQAEEARTWASRYNEQLAARAEAGDSKAMLQLGSRYLTGGDYTPVSIEKAVTWFTRAAEAGEPSAAYVLGEVFAKQGNVAASGSFYTQAYELYTKRAAADAADAESLYWLGFMQQSGIGTARDVAAGIARLEQAAELGSAWASTQLFKTYYNGIGTQRDTARAYTYARRLADEKEDGAMAYLVASALIFGRDGLARDEALGERYLDRAVRANIPDAIYMKASRLEAAGKLGEALPLLKQAASMQQREAVDRLGSLLLHGAEGVEADPPRGLSLLELAGNRLGSPLAAWELARYYDSVGESELADSWYVTASNRGVAEAMARRGLLHLLPGLSVSWSPTEAYRWWRAGKQAGDPTCTLYVNLFLYAFTPLLLLLVFGLPVYIGHRARRKLNAR